MKCSRVRKVLLSHADEELPARRRKAVQEHLKNCEDCFRQYEMLSNIFSDAREFERVQHSPFLWTKLSSRIEEYESSRNPFTRFMEFFPRYAMTFAIVAFISLGIVTGIFLGSTPDSQRRYDPGSNSNLTAEDQFVESLCLDVFDDLPPESLGGIFVTMTSEKK